MAKQQPFLALVIPAPEQQGQPGGPPGQAPGGPPGQGPGGGGPPGQQPGAPVFPSHPIYIEPPELPEVPEGSKLVLVWDGEDFKWAVISGGQVSQLPTDRPTPKRR